MEERFNLLQIFLDDLHGLDVPEGYYESVKDLIYDVQQEIHELEEKLVEERHAELRSMNASFESNLL